MSVEKRLHIRINNLQRSWDGQVECTFVRHPYVLWYPTSQVYTQWPVSPWLLLVQLVITRQLIHLDTIRLSRCEQNTQKTSFNQMWRVAATIYRVPTSNSTPPPLIPILPTNLQSAAILPFCWPVISFHMWLWNAAHISLLSVSDRNTMQLNGSAQQQRLPGWSLRLVCSYAYCLTVKCQWFAAAFPAIALLEKMVHGWDSHSTFPYHLLH